MSDRVIIPLGALGVLDLDRDTFEAALVNPAKTAAPPPLELLDSKACAARLNVSARQLEDLARAGIIPCHRIGRFVRFDPAEIAAHTATSAGAIPGTDRAATGSESVGHGNGLARQRVARGVSAVYPVQPAAARSPEGRR